MTSHSSVQPVISKQPATPFCMDRSYLSPVAIHNSTITPEKLSVLLPPLGCCSAALVDGQYVFVNVLLKNVYLGLGKLPGADLLLKEKVQLCKGAASGLGDAEVRIYDAQEADAALGLELV